MSARSDGKGETSSAVSEADLATCLRVLAALSGGEGESATYLAVERAVASLVKAVKKRRRRERQRKARHADRALVSGTARFAGSNVVAPLVAKGEGEWLKGARRCYVCKQPYHSLHWFYHLLCPTCAEENYDKRSARVDLGGRRALITGGRVKIGFATALRLLRDGAAVTVTTRFADDARRRFAAVPGAERWGSRLRIVALDLRHLPRLMSFLDDELGAGEPLDILINNAAQTVRRPPAYYAALSEGEGKGGADRDALARPSPDETTLASYLTYPIAAEPTADERRLFPLGLVDDEGMPLDLRPHNSWGLTLGEVAAPELVETHVVNALAPFLLAGRLKPLFLRSRFADRYVVNVSAVEGQFERPFKSVRHPHTNAAKAALNMMTRTSGADYARSGVFMTSVDTGWVTDENAHPLKSRLRERGFRTPLDVEDGASRVYDPIVRGVGGDRLFGCFLKDYRVAPW